MLLCLLQEVLKLLLEQVEFMFMAEQLEATRQLIHGLTEKLQVLVLRQPAAVVVCIITALDIKTLVAAAAAVDQ